MDIREAVGDTNIPILAEIVPSMSKLLAATVASKNDDDDVVNDEATTSTLDTTEFADPTDDYKSMMKTAPVTTLASPQLQRPSALVNNICRPILGMGWFTI